MKTLTVCPCCGSASVWRDAAINVNTKALCEYDCMACGECGYDGHTFNEVEVSDDFDFVDIGIDKVEIVGNLGANAGKDEK